MTDSVDSKMVAAIMSEVKALGLSMRTAESVRVKFPEIDGCLVASLAEYANSREWRIVEVLANLGALLRIPGLGAELEKLLTVDDPELNMEDVVDILGEIREVSAAPSLFDLVCRRVEQDGPAYWLSQKVIFSLSEFETSDSTELLRKMTDDSWPRPVRWYAAVALGIEDDLGFAEDDMLT